LEKEKIEITSQFMISQNLITLIDWKKITYFYSPNTTRVKDGWRKDVITAIVDFKRAIIE